MTDSKKQNKGGTNTIVPNKIFSNSPPKFPKQNLNSKRNATPINPPPSKSKNISNNTFEYPNSARYGSDVYGPTIKFQIKPSTVTTFAQALSAAHISKVESSKLGGSKKKVIKKKKAKI